MKDTLLKCPFIGFRIFARALESALNIGVPTCIWDEEAQKTESTFRAIARDI